jgi:molybdopterin-guanine dinucleotide biosynthesis protein A
MTNATDDRRLGTVVAVRAGGGGRRRGGAKPLAPLAGAPLIARVLEAARGFETVVVAKRDTALPALAEPVWIEPDAPSHPLCGLVYALERAGGPVLAVACDQPWVTGKLLRELAAAGPAVPWVGRYEPFPGHYVPGQLPVLREALAAEASLRATLERLAPARVEVPVRLVASVNTPEELAAAERALVGGGGTPWFIDAMNVIGSRPDGWWRDREGAVRRLVEDVRAWAAEEPVTVVLDAGPDDLLGTERGVRVIRAERTGRNAADDTIVALVRDVPDALVVTSDAELAARVRALGARVEGAGTFRRRLDRRS